MKRTTGFFRVTQSLPLHEPAAWNPAFTPPDHAKSHGRGTRKRHEGRAPGTRWFLAILIVAAVSAHGISPAELQQEMAKGTKLSIIDVRNTEVYQRAHIPGAINVPAALCPAKKLPPLGRVIVYDGGLGNNEVQSAAAALEAKPGINVEILEGGFAAWEALNLPDTRARGAERQGFTVVTYQQIKTNFTDDIVLVDLRQAQPAGAATKSAPAQPAARADLQGAFPQARVTRSPFNVAGRAKAGGGEAAPPLLVLIDKGDGAAEEMARTLRANGMRRFVILAGGEEMILREGQSGLNRAGGIGGAFVPATTGSN